MEFVAEGSEYWSGLDISWLLLAWLLTSFPAHAFTDL
ncbi:hypothetical protein RKD54_003427 [Pseudarthrobacter sp. SLBN-100]